MEQLGRTFFNKDNVDKVVGAVVEYIQKTFNVTLDAKNMTFIRDYQDLAKQILNTSQQYLMGFPPPQQLAELNKLVYNHLIAHVKKKIDEMRPSPGAPPSIPSLPNGQPQLPPQLQPQPTYRQQQQQQQQQQMHQQQNIQTPIPQPPFPGHPSASSSSSIFDMQTTPPGQFGGMQQQPQQLQQQQQFPSMGMGMGMGMGNNGEMLPFPDSSSSTELPHPSQITPPTPSSSTSIHFMDRDIPHHLQNPAQQERQERHQPQKPRIECERIKVVIDPTHPSASSTAEGPDATHNVIFPIGMQGVKAIRLQGIGMEGKADYTLDESQNVFAYSFGTDSDLIHKEHVLPPGHYEWDQLMAMIVKRTMPELLITSYSNGTITIRTSDKQAHPRLELEFHRPQSMAKVLGFENRLYQGQAEYQNSKHSCYLGQIPYVIVDIAEAKLRTVLSLIHKQEMTYHSIKDTSYTFPSPTFIPQLTVKFERPSGQLFRFRGRPWHIILNVLIEKVTV